MKFFLGILAGLLVAVGIAGAAAYFAFDDLIEISERDKSEDINQNLFLENFDRIEVAGVYELDVNVGPEFSVNLSGSPEALKIVKASVEDRTLVLDFEDHAMGKRRLRSSAVTAEITMPTLLAIEVSGIIDGEISNVDSEDFEIDISGVGHLKINGKCGKLYANFSGVGDLEADELKCKDTTIEMTGIGDANVYASKRVDATVSGIGSISVKGNPSNVDKTSGMLSSIDIN